MSGIKHASINMYGCMHRTIPYYIIQYVWAKLSINKSVCIELFIKIGSSLSFFLLYYVFIIQSQQVILFKSQINKVGTDVQDAFVL